MLLFITIITSIAQNLNYTASNSDTEANQIVTIVDNQIGSMGVVEKNTNTDALEFRYYYLPNMYAYFDLKTNKYIYKINNRWKISSELPRNYGGYSLFKNTKIPIRNYVGNHPQKKLNEHKKQFPYIKKSRVLKTMNLDGNTSLSSIN